MTHNPLHSTVQVEFLPEVRASSINFLNECILETSIIDPSLTSQRAYKQVKIPQSYPFACCLMSSLMLTTNCHWVVSVLLSSSLINDAIWETALYDVGVTRPGCPDTRPISFLVIQPGGSSVHIWARYKAPELHLGVKVLLRLQLFFWREQCQRLSQTSPITMF